MNHHTALAFTALLTALPTTALASQSCELESVKQLTLDAADIKTLQVSIGPDALRLKGGDQNHAELQIRMCASSQGRLNAMQAEQIKRDDTVALRLDHGGQVNRSSSSWFGLRRSASYSYFDISGTVPNQWALDITVGSGDAEITHVAAVNIVIGSGDATLKDIAGRVSATIGSGDLEVERAGSLSVGSIGSGDLEAEHIAGDVDIGNIGSGDAELDHIRGDVSVGNIGSGSLDVEQVTGSVSVASLGSGNITARHIEGDFTLRSKGSGSVNVSRVNGTVSMPNR